MKVHPLTKFEFLSDRPNQALWQVGGDLEFLADSGSIPLLYKSAQQGDKWLNLPRAPGYQRFPAAP